MNQWKIENTFLPEDTKKALGKPDNIDNYALKLNKAVNFFKNKELESAFESNDNFKELEKVLYKSEFKDKQKNLKNFNIDFNFQNWNKENSDLIKKIYTRHLDNANSLLGESNVTKFELSPDWRMALGLGNESVYETSITLHHIYGIPYIPASAIKGITRSWIITNCFQNKEKDAIQNQIFCDMFGCSEFVSYKDENGKKQNQPSYYAIQEPNIGGTREGKIIFFDAFPTSAPNIEPDIMNNHYSDYYDGKGSKPPADYYNPNPIFFLTVKNREENGKEVPCKFRFIIGYKNKLAPIMQNASEQISSNLKQLLFFKKIIDGRERSVCYFPGMNQDSSTKLTLLELTKAWLKLALTEHGIGAKTAVGYGYMK
jgi:CRISPR-associated protein Cmr6